MPEAEPADHGTADALTRLLAEQRTLQETVGALLRRVAALEARHEATGSAEAAPSRSPASAAVPPAPAAAPSPVPPPLPVRASVETIPPLSAHRPLAAPEPPPAVGSASKPAPPPLPERSAAANQPASPPLIPPPSLELRIGTTWFVRIGIVALLTGFVFLAGYLYQYVVPHLGPAGKVALLLLGAGALTGLGAWLERNAQRRDASGLLNYARVVFGGGLAAVYYVAYAAHANPGLRVIESAFVAGALQLAWAGFIVWLADRRDSQTLATFAILLGYFTAASSEVGTFTLFSNLALTVAAVFLLTRHRWTAFSFASLTATYGSYVFWRLQHPAEIPRRDGTTFWVELGFFALYWTLFTLAVFRTTREKLPPGRRATFATLNNGAFFSLVAARLHEAHPDKFWLLCVSFGTVLVALSFPGRRSRDDASAPPIDRAPLWLPLDAATTSAYRLLGLALLTLGIVNYYAGWSLVVALTVESVVLTLAACTQPTSGRRLLPLCAAAVGFLACGDLCFRLQLGSTPPPGFAPDSKAVLLACSLAAAFLFNAFWSRRRARSTGRRDASAPSAGPIRDWLPGVAVAFSGLGALAALALLDTQLVTPLALRPAALAVGALALTALAYPLELGALAAFAQALLLVAVYRSFELTIQPGFSAAISLALWPPWSALIVVVAATALCHWWQRQRHFIWPLQARSVWVPLAQAWLALGAVAIGFFRLTEFNAPTQLALCTALAGLVLLYGLLTRSWAIAGASQLFLVAAVIAFGEGLVGALTPKPGRWIMLAPTAAALVVPALARRLQLFWKLGDDSVPVRVRAALFPLGVGYEILALLMFLGWTEEFVPAQAQFLTLAASGAATFALAFVLRQHRWLVFSAVLTLAGVGAFGFREITLPLRAHFSGLHGLAIVCIAAQQIFARCISKISVLPPPPGSPPPLPLQRLPEWAHSALILLATVGAWSWLTDAIVLEFGGSLYLVAGWSGFAAVLFAVGILLRERAYRWLGLGVLALTLGRVGVVEFWQADALGRILGLLALGAVLLALGFVYNRYSAKLREWM